jgi:hypothetical protein
MANTQWIFHKYFTKAVFNNGPFMDFPFFESSLDLLSVFRTPFAVRNLRQPS